MGHAFLMAAAEPSSRLAPPLPEEESPMSRLRWLQACEHGPRRGAWGVLAASLAAVLLGNAAPACAGLIINPTFDTTITSDPNSAALQADINTAIGIYQSLYADPITVSIDFRYATTRPNGNPMGTAL